MRSNSSGVRPCCLTSSGVTAGSASGIWVVIDEFTLTNPKCRSIAQIRIFHQIATSWKRPPGLRTTNFEYQYQEEGGTMANKTIIALACTLIASPVFAQVTVERGRYYRTAPAITTSQGVIVTAPPIIDAQEGSAAAYQPAGTLVVRTDSANPERFDSF